MPKRERYLWVCTNERDAENPKGCCSRGGAEEIRNQLKVGLVKRRLVKNVRVCESSCLDLCWAGPAVAVMPDNVFYGRVRPEDVPEILDSLEQGTVVERLVLGPEAFDDPGKVPPCG
ncbi:MAG: (2Fe-2S) ferredoxin domain-containing protein [Myxococcales bacterium]|nr:(2Fe-2S) ferredoxin domain-containing protein [Myxococcales bacterium]